MNVAVGGNLAAIKAMVPSEVSANAFDYAGEFVPLLMVVMRSNQNCLDKCSDEGHAIIQYLIEQGADPNVILSNNDKSRPLVGVI